MIKRARVRANRHKAAPLTPDAVAARYGPPLAPVVISRVPVFAPVLRRGRVTVWVQETAWGRVEVRGRLTQLHRCLLDAAIAIALTDVSHSTADGGMFLVCDPYRLTRAMSTTTWDYRWLESLLEDLRQARIRVVEHCAAFPFAVTGIVTAYGGYDRQKRLRTGRLSHRDDDLRDMIYLTFSGAWWAMWGDRPAAHYRTLLARIAGLAPVGQAVARLCLTQRDGWQIGTDKALQTVGAWDPGSSPAAQQRRRRARRELEGDRDQLARLGVFVDAEARTIHYRRPAGVYVSVPPGAIAPEKG